LAAEDDAKDNVVMVILLTLVADFQRRGRVERLSALGGSSNSPLFTDISTSTRDQSIVTRSRRSPFDTNLLQTTGALI